MINATRPTKVIVYGVGEMGAIVTRLLVDKGVEIVGAIARSPHKVGRDLGEVAGLGTKLGVAVEGDPQKVLSREADIAVVCVGSYLETMYDHFALCLENGVNIVTIEEESVFPWTSDPIRAQALDALARENGVTLAASGAQDVFWLNLVTVLLGASHRVDKVVGICSWNVDDYGPEVAEHVFVGRSKDDFDRYVTEHGWPEFVARQNLEAMVAKLKLTVETIHSNVEPVLAVEDINCHCLNTKVPSGDVIGTIDKTQIKTLEGPEFELSMVGRVYRKGETDINKWEVYGEPDLHLENVAVPYRFITCSTLVNRIPDVLDAEPGLLSLDKLGPARYWHVA